MAACVSRSVGLPPIFPGSASSLKMEDHCGENGNRGSASVLRRTLSAAEMLKPQTGGLIKKTGSVENLQSLISGSGSGSGSGSNAFEAIWNSIQKKEDDVAPAVYVHPMVKRSASSLSEKSLEICTESLGSETGAEAFTFPEPEIGKDVVAPVTRSKRMVATAATVASLPPPLPSLGNRDDGSNVQMRCHRRDGRLVVEAVSMPSRNCFKAERQGGRLLLTFSSDEENDDVSDDEEEDESSDEEEEEEGEEVTMVDPVEEVSSGNRNSGGMKTMMKYVDNSKFLFLTRRMNKVVPTYEDDSVAKSTWTPPPPTTMINPYVYSWRSNEIATRGERVTVTDDVEAKRCNGNFQEAPPRGAAPLLFWRGRCIATS